MPATRMLFSLLIAAVLLQGCTAPKPKPPDPAKPVRAFREPTPRRPETIFSPLDLPAPSHARTASGTPGPDYWQQRVDYSIDATLDEPARTIRAAATITYTNNSPEDLPFLWLHLEQNLFRPVSTGTLMREESGRFGNRNPFNG